MHFGLIDDFVDVVNGDERLGVGLGDKVHQQAVLILIHDRNDFDRDRIGVRALGFIQSRAAVQRIQDIVQNFLAAVRNDADAALDVAAEDKVIEHHAVQIGLPSITVC